MSHVEYVSTIEEIKALVASAGLQPEDEGELQPLDAVRDLRLTKGRACGQGGLGYFIGIKNTNRSKRIRAYYRIDSNINGPWHDNAWINPLQTHWVVCSYPAPNQYMSVGITAATYEDPC